MDLTQALEIASCTDPGMVRSHNEDSIAADPANGLVVLADGMGGYNAGEVASGMATAVIVTEMQQVLASVQPYELDPHSREPIAPQTVHRFQALEGLSQERPGCPRGFRHGAAKLPVETAAGKSPPGQDGGRGTRTPKGFRPAVFKTAALPVRSSPPLGNLCTSLAKPGGGDSDATRSYASLPRRLAHHPAPETCRPSTMPKGGFDHMTIHKSLEPYRLHHKANIYNI